MSGFSSQWLALREPVDLAARNRDVEAAFLAQCPEDGVKLLDLASGAGSTRAALRDRLPEATAWRMTDYDPALIGAASARLSDKDQDQVSFQQIDLAADLESLPFAGVDGVTTSAFLDLVSEPFLARLATCVAKARKPFLASLTYDGRASFAPDAGLDGAMREAMNRDQRSDKGFGPALGPEAAAAAIGLFEAQGYRVVQGRSDWQAGAQDSAFLLEFLEGWAGVGRKSGLDGEAVGAWWQQRQREIRTGALEVTVGHVDFAALPV